MSATLGAEALHRVMRTRNLTQVQVAASISEHVGRLVVQSTVSKHLRGHVPGLAYALAYRDLFGIVLEAWSEPADSHRAA